MMLNGLRYPLALLGGIVFAALLLIAAQGLLLHPTTTPQVAQTALLLDRVRLDEPSPSQPAPPQTPAPKAAQPQRPSPATPYQAVAAAPVNLNDAAPLYDMSQFSLDPMGPTGQPWAAVDSSLVILNRREPIYPPTAARRGVEGWVKLQFTVGVDGQVQDAVVVEAQPSNLFDRAALQAVRQWRFKPRRINGQAVVTPVVQTLSFRLDT